jgi:type III secretion system YscD/HrpQ family protein
MQVTLIPVNSSDSPFRLDLEDPGSTSLGGSQAQAELSWDLLPADFLVLFHLEGGNLAIESRQLEITVDGQKVTGQVTLTKEGLLSFGEVECRYTCESSPQTPSKDTTSSESNEDDIFKSSPQDANSQFNTSFQTPSGLNVDASRWLFKVLTGPNAGAQMSLEEGKIYTIGSDGQSCDIVLADLSVSKQHLKLSVFASGEMVIEDLKSRNGVLINGEKIEEKSTQTSSAIVTAGATTFMVVDRTSEQKTIVTPALPVKERIVVEKVVEKSAQAAQAGFGELKAKPATPAEPPSIKRNRNLAFAALGAIVLILGFGVFSLFDEELIVREQKTAEIQEIAAILEEYPYFEYNFNPSTGILTLTGHILTDKDKRSLLTKLSQIDSINRIDDTNLVVDELVWHQFNMAIEKLFKGINLSAGAPGEFVLNGTMDTLVQAEKLNQYLTVNFPYNNALQNKVVVLEQLLASINERLQAISPGELVAELNAGELILVGTVSSSRAPDFQQLVDQIRNTAGIRSVRNLVIEQTNADESGVIDISQSYKVTGFSKASDVNTSIMINGKILQRGDQLDGMTITSIRPRIILLERDGIKYRINYTP